MSNEETVAIDCGTCDLRGIACSDCVVSVFLGVPPSALDDEEQRALGVLADSGLVPPLRLVPHEISTDSASPADQGRRAG